MRLPWISQRPSQRAATRRKRATPLRVRRLERRRVLDAAVTDLVFAPADLDGSTAIHDTNEGSQVTATGVASGSGALLYEWTVTKDAALVAQSFSQTLNFTPLDNGVYDVTLTVYDSFQSTASRTESVLVHNLRPVLVAAPDQMLNEGSLLDLSAIGAPPLGLFIDSGILDTHTATVDWGDGSAIEAPTIFAANGSGALGGTHTYTDNGVYQVTVTVTDDDGGVDTQSFFVTVNNVAPTGTLSNSGPVGEGSSATVTFTNQFDPSTADTTAGFRYAYDLDNDGVFDVGDGTYGGSVATGTQIVPTALLADGPGTGTVRAWIIDKDGAHTEYTTNITISNVAPELLDITVTDASINEGETATITMTIADPGTLDVFAVEVDWQDGGQVDTISGLGAIDASGTVGGTTYEWDAQARELTVSHLYPDDNPTVTSSDVYAVALTVRDDDLGVSGPYMVDVTVSNVQPVLVVAADQAVNEGGLLDLSANGAPPLAMFVDDGILDTHIATVDWGDGSAIESPAIVAANGSGTLGATHTYADNGIFTVTVTVTDDDGGVDTQQFLVTVANVAPTAVLSNSGPVGEGSTATVSFTNQFDPSTADTTAGFRYAYDLDNDGTFDVGDGTYAGSVVSSTQLISAALLVEGPGMHTVKGRIIDKDGGFTDYTTTIVINNIAPELVNVTIVDASINEGETATITMTVDDPGALDVFEIDVNWQDGGGVDTITGLGASNASGTVGDTAYEWIAATRQLTVSHLYQDDNPTGTPSDLYQVTLAVRDDDGGVSGPYMVDITVSNVRPVLVVAADQAVNEGGLLDLSAIGAPPLALFVDDGVLDTHTATVDWGDGSAVESPVVIAANGSGVLAATHTYADDGVYTVTVTVTDDDGGVDTQQFLVTVANVAPTLGVTPSPTTINEGGAVGFDAVFSDPGFDNPLNLDGPSFESFTYDVDWGDGRDAIVGMSVVDANGMPGVDSTGMFSGSHTYADDGVYTVTVTIRDDDGGVDTHSFQVTVNNVAPTVSVTPSPTSIDEGGTVSFDASFSDPGFDNPLNPSGETEESFTYDVDWGDGRDAIVGQTVADTNGSPGTPSTGMFSGSHTYADDGVYTVTVTIYDDDGGSHVQTFEVTVANVAPTLVLPNGNRTVNEGELLSLANLATFSDPGFDNPLNPSGETEESFTYDVDWGDGRDAIVGASIVDTNGGPGVDSTGTIAGSHAYADNGIYVVTVTIYDDDGGSHTQTFEVTVNNVAPALDVTPSPTTINEGETVNFAAVFSDPGFDNPLNPGGATAESFRYFVDWGDGRDQVPNSAVADMNGGAGVPTTGEFSGSHTYADDGVYTVTVRIADDDMSGNFAGGVAGVDYVEKTFTVTVENLPPSLTGTSNVSVEEGTAFTLTGLGVGLEDHGFDNPLNPTTPSLGDPLRETFTSFMVDWGDGSAPTALSIDNVNDRISGSPGVTTTALFTHGAHTYADDGVYTVTIRVADDNMSGDFVGGVAGVDYVDLTFTITVNNVVPTLHAIGNQTVNESQDLVLPVLATFTDPGFDNSNNPTTPATGDRFNESFSYFLDWGDGREQIGSLDVADLNGPPGTPSSGSFGGTHNYADNGVYTVTIRLADDNMSGNFATGIAGVDYVEQTFTVTVNNVGPSFTPQPNGDSFQGDEVNTAGVTTIRVGFNDPGYDNPLNTSTENGGETVETFNHIIQWGDGTVDAIHPYESGGEFTVIVTMTPASGSPQQFTFQNFNSGNPVLTLVSSQQLNDPGVVAQVVTYTVDWGDGHEETFQLSLLNPGLPVASNGLTTLVTSSRNSGNATTLTTGTAEIRHRYLGPPDPLHPTADIIITLTVYDDDGAGVTDSIAIGNPGIQVINIAIDTTPDVPRLDLTMQPMTVVFVADQSGGGQSLQVPDLRSGGGEVAATAERYLELRVVNPDGTESEGHKIKDEALADLRAFFKTLPDGKYRIYLIRTENRSDERLVIEVDVRRGRVIDVSDDSEGTRDRPPTGEERPGEAAPLDQNPLLENRQGDLETRRQGELVETVGQDDEQVSLSPPLLVSLSASAAAFAAEPWSRRVDDALAGADENAWRRLRRAGRSGRSGRRTPANRESLAAFCRQSRLQ